jgi:hypothetical protein
MDETLKQTHTMAGFDRQDRDLLIRLNTRVEDLIASLEKKDNLLAQDIGGLKAGKLDKDIYTAHCTEDEKDLENTNKEITAVWKVTDEHTADIKSLNRYLWLGMGALAVIQFIMPFIISKYFK